MATRLKPQAQAQAVDVALTQQTSLTTVKTLLSTGLDCIAYLRSLFSDEHFVDNKLEAPRAPISDSNPPSSSQVEKTKQGPQTVRVKKLDRGVSKEGDKYLDWIEKGAADALEKNYLQQLVLAIYLDPSEPHNVVECYSFTFAYETDADGNKRPEMVVRNQLSGMVLSDTGSTSGKRQTKEGEAGRQVQQMIKALIANTQAMNELPRRRFITIRLYYTEDTPSDYEPPLFSAVVSDQKQFQLTTSSVNEQPDIVKMGTLNTGFHGVTLQAISVTPLLEIKYDEHISLGECLTRNQDDASTRPVVWDAKALVEAIDPEWSVQPVGIKDEEGVLRTVEEVKEGGEKMSELRKVVGLEAGSEEDEVVFAGEKEARPEEELDDNEALQQALEKLDPPERHDLDAPPSTQYSPVTSRQRSVRPPVPLFHESEEEYFLRTQSVVSVSGGDRGLDKVVEGDDEEEEEDTGEEREMSPELGPEISHGFDGGVGDDADSVLVEDTPPDPDTLYETGPEAGVLSPEPSDLAQQAAVTPNQPIAPPEPSSTSKGEWAKKNNRVGKCDCGDPAEDGDMVWCCSCSQWKHVVCYGYHSSKDHRLPSDEVGFVCYPCRVVCADSDALLNPDRENEVIAALDSLSGLALFRRALALWMEEGIKPQSDLKNRLAIDASTASQLLKRLKNEKFTIDSALPAGKKSVPRGKKHEFVVNKSKEQKKMMDDKYFTPGGGDELGLSYVLDPSEQDAEAGVDESDGTSETYSLRSSSRTARASPPTPPPFPVKTRPPVHWTYKATKAGLRTSRRSHISKSAFPSAAPALAPPPAPAPARRAHRPARVVKPPKPLTAEEEDPIQTSDDEDEEWEEQPLSTPEQARESARKARRIEEQLERKAQQQKKQQQLPSTAPRTSPISSEVTKRKPLNVPAVDTGKARTGVESPIQTPTTPQATQVQRLIGHENSMDIDGDDSDDEEEEESLLVIDTQEPTQIALPRSPVSNKRRLSVGGDQRGKKVKVSEGGEVEV
ncbi:meiosis-specific protein HOP1 [Pseudohyphozyma bogoriensis]|nr:meiosis-specific protein HOP1 [Pseudohyphozyma bogoriensis]